jgi:hypothetical protein
MFYIYIQLAGSEKPHTWKNKNKKIQSFFAFQLNESIGMHLYNFFVNLFIYFSLIVAQTFNADLNEKGRIFMNLRFGCNFCNFLARNFGNKLQTLHMNSDPTNINNILRNTQFCQRNTEKNSKLKKIP